MNDFDPNDAGKPYPNLGPTVAKHRRAANYSRQEHGAAVEIAIRALQRSELRRAAPSISPSCASGTWYSDGADIHRAIRAQQAAALARAPGSARRARTPEEWQKLYDEAMKAKRGK